MSENYYLGRKVKEKTFVEAKSRIIQPDEELIGVIKGRMTRGARKRGEKGDYIKGLLVMTDKRAIFYVKQTFGRYDEVVFPYEQINSVYSHKGIIGDRVDIAAMTDSVTIDYVPKGDGQVAVEKINEMMSKAKSPQVVVQSSEPSASIPEQIEKLADLKEKGVLTEEEFEKKKADLLEKM